MTSLVGVVALGIGINFSNKASLKNGDLATKNAFYVTQMNLLTRKLDSVLAVLVSAIEEFFAIGAASEWAGTLIDLLVAAEKRLHIIMGTSIQISARPAPPYSIFHGLLAMKNAGAAGKMTNLTTEEVFV